MKEFTVTIVMIVCSIIGIIALSTESFKWGEAIVRQSLYEDVSYLKENCQSVNLWIYNGDKSQRTSLYVPCRYTYYP